MDPSLMMLLPKGIVLNIDRVYKEVATYPVVPPEKIYEYWHGIDAASAPCTTPEPRLTECQSTPQPMASSRIPRPVVWRISGGMCWAVTGNSSRGRR